MKYLSPPPAMTARKKRRGFSLIEAAIVLGVVGLVIGGIWYAAASVQQSQRINETSDGIIAMCDQLTNLYRSMPTQPVTNESLEDLLLKENIIPPNWSRSGMIFTPLNVDTASKAIAIVCYEERSEYNTEGIG